MAKRLWVTILVGFAVILLLARMQVNAKPPPPCPDLNQTQWYMPFQCAVWDKEGGFADYNLGARYVGIQFDNVTTGNLYGWTGNLDDGGNVNAQYPITGNISLSTWAFTAIQRDESPYVPLGYWVYSGTSSYDTIYQLPGTYNH